MFVVHMAALTEVWLPDKCPHARGMRACTLFATYAAPPRCPSTNVYPGVYKADGEACAVKVINRKPLENKDTLAQEVMILRSLDHPQVVR